MIEEIRGKHIVVERDVLLWNARAYAKVVGKPKDVGLYGHDGATGELEQRAGPTGFPGTGAGCGVAGKEKGVIPNGPGAGTVCPHGQCRATGVEHDVIFENAVRTADDYGAAGPVNKKATADRDGSAPAAKADQGRTWGIFDIQRTVRRVTVPGGSIEDESIDDQPIAVFLRTKDRAWRRPFGFLILMKQETRGICPGIASGEIRVIAAEEREVANGNFPLARVELAEIIAARNMDSVAALRLFQSLKRIAERLSPRTAAALGTGLSNPSPPLGRNCR